MSFTLAFPHQGCNSSTFTSKHTAADHISLAVCSFPHQLTGRWTVTPDMIQSLALSSASEWKYEPQWDEASEKTTWTSLSELSTSGGICLRAQLAALREKAEERSKMWDSKWLNGFKEIPSSGALWIVFDFDFNLADFTVLFAKKAWFKGAIHFYAQHLTVNKVELENSRSETGGPFFCMYFPGEHWHVFEHRYYI